MKVEQFYNKNQFIIRDGGKTVFQSYDSTIAIYENGVLTLGHDWDYSKTTSKHLYLFIDEYCMLEGFDIQNKNKKSWVQKNIDNGKIKYDNDLR